MSARLVAATALLALGTLVAGAVSAQSSTPSGNATHGAALFVTNGCYECHGVQGEGTGARLPRGIVGPMLAPKPIPYEAFIKQLRDPRAVMAPYSAKVLSDRDAADIYAYLSSIPAVKPPSTIRLLETVKPEAGS